LFRRAIGFLGLFAQHEHQFSGSSKKNNKKIRGVELRTAKTKPL
jgi:hypothetical protein